MLLDWLKLTSWLRQRGLDESEIASEVARNLNGNPYHVDAATVGPEQREKAINKPARWYDDDEVCQGCGHIFVVAHTHDIELVTSLCQSCWGNRVRRAHQRGDV